jgi:hypothetical protein
MLLMFIFIISVVMVLSLNKDNIGEVEIYKAVKEQMPYSMEYNFKKGFEIIDKRDGSVIESTNSNIYKKMEALQSDWMSKHIVIDGNKVTIMNDKKEVVKEITVKNSVDMDKIKSFFKIK